MSDKWEAKLQRVEGLHSTLDQLENRIGSLENSLESKKHPTVVPLWWFVTALLVVLFLLAVGIVLFCRRTSLQLL